MHRGENIVIGKDEITNLFELTESIDCLIEWFHDLQEYTEYLQEENNIVNLGQLKEQLEEVKAWADEVSLVASSVEVIEK